MTPNLSKILYSWGLKEEVQQIVQPSDGLDLLLRKSNMSPFESVEFSSIFSRNRRDTRHTRMGRRADERNSRGFDLLTCPSSLPTGKKGLTNMDISQYNDIHDLMYKAALSIGATIRFNAKVVSIDPDTPSVTLSTGETLTADVIVGADGVNGVSRPMLLQGDTPPPTVKVYRYFVSVFTPPPRLTYITRSTTIPKDAILADPTLDYIYNQELVRPASLLLYVIFNTAYRTKCLFGSARAPPS